MIFTNRVSKIAIYVCPILLAVMFSVICLKSISYNSPTSDEHRHLTRGLMLLKTGDYRMNTHHPILANILNALPQLFNKNLKIPSTDSIYWQKSSIRPFAEELVSINGGKRDFTFNVLNLSRYVSVLAIMLIGLSLFFLIRKEAGFFVAFVFCFLYFFCPNIIAHSRLVTNDSWIMAFVFLTTFALYKYLKEPSLKLLTVFILLASASLLMKYSAIPIVAIWLAVIFINEFARSATKNRVVLKRLGFASGKVLIIFFILVIILTAAYGFNFRSPNEEHASYFRKIPLIGGVLEYGYKNIKLPFPQYWQGFYVNVVIHNTGGHDAYLHGAYSKNGWWYYFPVTLLVKLQIPALLGVLGLLVWASIIVKRRIEEVKTKGTKLFESKTVLSGISSTLLSIGTKPWTVFITVPLLYFFLAMKSNINIGIRHILIVLPFLYFGIALLCQKIVEKKSYMRFFIMALGLWYIFSTASVYPHYIEYFNEFVRPENGWKWLLDSNLCWGQNDFYAQDYANKLKGKEKVYINPEHKIEEGVVIVDIDVLMGRRPKWKEWEWLKNKFLKGEIAPIDKIAYTYFVFKIEKKKTHESKNN